MSLSDEQSVGSRHIVITAEIVSYKLKKGGTENVFAVYTIQCSINSSETWEIEKRYSEFRKLHKVLDHTKASLENFSFPKKKWLFNLSETVLQDRKNKFHAFLLGLLSRDPVPVELLDFLESRERVTAFRFLDKERQSIGSARGSCIDTGTGVSCRARITSTGSLIDDVTAQDFAVLKVLGQVFTDEKFVRLDVPLPHSLNVAFQGSFGRVYLVRPLGGQPSSLYAMKVLRKSEVEQRRQVEHTLTERNIMATMRHCFVLALRVGFQSADRLFMLTDYCPGGELFFHLKKMRRFTEDMMRFYCAELTVTIEFMHSKGVIYRDLKPENVLLDREGHIKLTDFGLSKILAISCSDDSCAPCGQCSLDAGDDSNGQPRWRDNPARGDRMRALSSVNDAVGRAYTFCGTPEYLAPEMLLHRHKGNGYGASIDWWALGIVCFELMTGWPPFFDKDFEQMSQKILMKPLRFPSKYGIRPEAQVMIRSLLERDPDARLPCCAPATLNRQNEAVSTHGLQLFKQLPFFQSLDWAAIESRSARPPFLPPMTGGFDDTSITICKPASEEGGDITTTTIQPKHSSKSIRGVESAHLCNGEAYKDFNFFDPSFRQSYLTGNASLLSD